tara:strand:- start:410 stop:598 length:189 start_codon:yes stop_codon:yes gene_type:complete
MIIKVEYNKSDATLTLNQDDDIVAIINDNTVVDNSNTLSFEIALDVSKYQEHFNEDINGSVN